MYPENSDILQGQVRSGDKGGWANWAPATANEEISRAWQQGDPTNRRVVDKDTGEVVFPAECDAFNIRKEGICGTPLTALDDCAHAYDHREI